MMRASVVRPTPVNPWVAWMWDAGERATRAYAASWCAVYGAAQISDKFDISLVDSLKAAFIGFFVSSMFSLAGKARGAPDSASVLNRAQDPPLAQEGYTPYNPDA